MSEFRMKFLPPHVHEKIIELLSFRDLKAASLVGNEWNDVFSHSDKFLDNAVITKRNLDVNLTRNYRNFVLKSTKPGKIVSIESNYIPIISNFASDLKTLIIEENRLDGKELIKFLKSCESIEELSLSDIEQATLSAEKLDEHVVFEKRLRKFTLKHSNWLYDCITIKNADMDKMSLTDKDSDYDKYTPADRLSTDMINFLNRLENVKIKHLTLEHCNMETPIELIPKFDWNIFTIFIKNNEDLSDEQKSDFMPLKNWIEMFKVAGDNSAFNLHLNYSADVNFEVLNLVAASDKITNLGIEMFRQSFYFGMDDGIEVFPHIKTLRLSCKSYLEEYLYKFPNVENFEIDFFVLEGMIQENVVFGENVKNFCIDSRRTTGDPLPYIELPQLECIEIKGFRMTQLKSLQKYKNVKQITLKLSTFDFEEISEKFIKSFSKKLSKILSNNEDKHKFEFEKTSTEEYIAAIITGRDMSRF